MLTLHVKSYVLPTECVCFVWISEQMEIVSLYSINLLVFIVAEGVCLLCGTSCFFYWQYSSDTCVRENVGDFVCRTACLKSVYIRKILRPAISIKVFLVFPCLQASAMMVPKIPSRNFMLLVQPPPDLNS
jgi:hypothetical protein